MKARFESPLLLVSAVLGLALNAAGSNLVPKPTKDVYLSTIRHYNFPDSRLQRLGGYADSASDIVHERHSLGTVRTTSSTTAGAIVDISWDDWQYVIKGRRVDFGTRPYIHFVYSELQSYPDGSVRYGYNVYNALTGTWPRGAQVGCNPQSDVDTGYDVTMAVTPSNRVVLAGRDNLVDSLPFGTDNHFYFQPITPFSCTFGAGSSVPWRQYMDGMVLFNRVSRLVDPVVEIQCWGSDTVVHVLARQSEPWWWSLSPNVKDVVMQYYRKATFGTSGTWTGPIALDTGSYLAHHLTASLVSPKVAYAYLRHRPEAYVHNQNNDLDVYYRESDSLGVTWKSPVNITNYDRHVPSYAPWLEVHALYDTNDQLHIVYNAAPVPAEPYLNGHFWESLYNGSSIFHWCSSTQLTTLVHRAEWDQDWMRYHLCGLLGWNALTTAFVNITECSGHIYVTWAMANDGDANPRIGNDCTTGLVHDWRFAGNGDIYLAVSSDLTGLTWDRYRNLTKTYTPWCNWAYLDGECLNDSRPSASRYGMNVNSYDTSGVPVTLTWPDTGFNPGPGPYTGTDYFHLFWIEDHYPGNYNEYWYGFGHAPATPNPLKWARVACVTPIVAAQIRMSPKSIGYPNWTKHGIPDTSVIEITNDGNATLSVGEIGTVKFTQTGWNWLATTVNSLSIPAGIGNTTTFGIIVNNGGCINTPGTIVALSGEVYLRSNAPSPQDSMTFSITNFLVADTVVGQIWDTVSTTCTRLIVSNNGDVGRLGAGTVNLDYFTSGTECDSSIRLYLYDGGPIIIRRYGSYYKYYVYTNAYGQGVFSTEKAFKPIAAGPGAGSFIGAGYDGFNTGTFVNKDSSVGLRRTYFAPLNPGDTCNFIIQKTTFFGVSGRIGEITAGEVLDWDIPSIYGWQNEGGVLQSEKALYQRGLDTLTPNNTRCIKYSQRFGSAVFLGMYSNDERRWDTCFNDANFYGSYFLPKDSLAKYDTLSNDLEGEHYWNQMQELSGLNPPTVQNRDFLTVMTYRHNILLDTLTVYTALITLKSGDTSSLKTSILKARKWYYGHLRPGCSMGTCCDDLSSDGRTGNVDADPYHQVDISDLAALIDYLYISFIQPVCPQSANIDGDIAAGVDISDLSALIDYLYISFTEPAQCIE